jgi:uncharacterized protein
MVKDTLDKKIKDLRDFFEEYKKTALAFSGGVDSSYLLYAAKINGCEIYPYFINTAFQPQFELDDAKKLASELGVNIKIVEYDILNDAKVALNEKNRCYHCKRALFAAVKQAAEADGCDVVIDGTNASDDAGDRPGMKALEEMGIQSPLRKAELSKEEIRKLCKKTGLFVWDKPSYSCLATRIPTGVTITQNVLGKIEKAEGFMRGLGFEDLRVRYFHGTAKVQVRKKQFEKAVSMKDDILSGLAPYFEDVLLDFRTRQ